MEKENDRMKKILIVGILAMTVLGAVGCKVEEKTEAEVPAVSEVETVLVIETEAEEQNEAEAEEISESEDKEEVSAIFEIDVLTSFLSENLIRDVKSKTLEEMRVAGKSTEMIHSVRAMNVQKVSDDRTEVAFYLIDDEETVYEGIYDAMIHTVVIWVSSLEAWQINEANGNNDSNSSNNNNNNSNNDTGATATSSQSTEQETEKQSEKQADVTVETEIETYKTTVD